MGRYLDLVKPVHREERTADEALALLRRLRAYTLPTGHIEVARTLARRLNGMGDPVVALDALRKLEAEFIDLGGRYDADVAAAMEAFLGSRRVN